MEKNTVPASPSSLISACSRCPSRCCSGNTVILSEVEFRRITDAGHDSAPLVPVDVPQGRYYMLDFRVGFCPYLENGRCSIEAAKPDTCRAYPLVVVTNRYGEFRDFGLNKAMAANCPATRIMSESFIKQAQNLLEQDLQRIPLAVKKQVRDTYNRMLQGPVMVAGR